MLTYTEGEFDVFLRNDQNQIYNSAVLTVVIKPHVHIVGCHGRLFLLSFCSLCLTQFNAVMLTDSLRVLLHLIPTARSLGVNPSLAFEKV